jgi:fructose-1,6-bisphosphatase/inositol monophosphatase family enzyme
MERELKTAVEAARKAAIAIRAVYDRQDFEVEQKADGKGPLTEADLAANKILIDTLSAAFPEDGILSEESKDDGSRLQRSRVWIIDPLDGTREFTLHVPEFVVSIGLVIDGAPTLGVLCNPATGELITGIVGQGVQYDGGDAATTEHGQIQGARFLVSRSEHKKGWFDAWKDEAEMTPATFTPKPRNEWDLAGGVACVLAGGGHCSNGKGEPYVFNQADPLHIGVCGTNGAIHEHVMGMMQR